MYFLHRNLYSEPTKMMVMVVNGNGTNWGLAVWRQIERSPGHAALSSRAEFWKFAFVL